MKKTIKTVGHVIVCLIIFTLVNIGLAEHLPLRYNAGATLALLAIVVLWRIFATHRRQRHFYEPFNGGRLY